MTADSKLDSLADAAAVKIDEIILSTASVEEKCLTIWRTFRALNKECLEVMGIANDISTASLSLRDRASLATNKARSASKEWMKFLKQKDVQDYSLSEGFMKIQREEREKTSKC